MRRPALVLALVAGCGVPVVQPLSEAKRLEPEKAVPKDSKAKPASDAPLADVPPPPRPETGPFRRPGAAAGQRDDFTFWGWSSDNLRYAFELHDYGPGGAACEGSYTLYVVDAVHDAFVEDPLKLAHKDPGADVCDPPDLAAAFERERPAVLQRHGIDVASQRPPITPTRVSAVGRGKAPQWTIRLAPDAELYAEVAVVHGGRKQAGEQGAAYKLTLSTKGGYDPFVIEPGERRRPYVWDYSLDEGLVFGSPDGRRLAVFLAMTRLSFEGDRHTYNSNGVVLPDSWVPGAE